MGKMNDKVWALVIFSLVFSIVYKFSLWYAAGLGNVSSFVFSFEKDIPFIPWTIVPYLSSGAFFCLVFFQIRSRDALRLFLKRVVLMTLLAGLFFIFMPLQYSYAKPNIENPVFRALFWLLEGVDDRYNQSPSLHVAFAFAFWTVFRELKTKWRTAAAFWLILVALSTLTTFQHHLIDIFTGSLLAHFVFIIFPSQQNQYGFRNMHVANCYFLVAWATMFTAFLLAEFYGFYWLNLGWLSIALFIVGYLYQRNYVGSLRSDLVKVRVFRNLF